MATVQMKDIYMNAMPHGNEAHPIYRQQINK